MTHTNTATVETLTAEVRVLMVGSRQVTLSVFRQLDFVKLESINPFGRVNSGTKYRDRYGYERSGYLEIVGSSASGELAKAIVLQKDERYAQFRALPLIVLAGLK